MSSHGAPIPMISTPCGPLNGTAEVPGDKSISHRSIILGAMAVGETVVTGLLEGDDVLDTAKAMRAFGADVSRNDDGTWRIHGVGVGGFAEPDGVIDCGNSGTGVRLIMGSMATTPITATFTGDASLNSRPMARVTDPLALLAVSPSGATGGRLPMTLVGAREAVPVRYTVPVPSAQVKSAVLLAGLNAPGQTVVIEKEATRDHTERMLAGFGAEITVEETEEGRAITLTGQPELTPQTIAVPRDPSSAAFPVCAALIVPGSDVLVPGIGLNPTRAGLFYTLQDMGADLTFENMREEGGEPVADLRARYSPDMKGIDVPPERAASMIDEYPILSVVAANATGTTMMAGVKELRVKESDRIEAMASGLRAAGVAVEDGPDWWAVEGQGPGGVAGGMTAVTHLDHRIAMSFLILGMAAKAPVTLDDGGPITTSFPIFEPLMATLGADLKRVPVSLARIRTGLGILSLVLFGALVWTATPILKPDGMESFDGRPLGYSFEQAQTYLRALSEEGAKTYLGPVRTLDTIFPPVFTAFLALMLHQALGGWTRILQVLALLLPGGYLVMDFAENALVAEMVRGGAGALTPDLAERASHFTQAKYAALAGTVLVMGAALVWSRIAGRDA